MPLVDTTVLADVGLTHYERQALVTLMAHGVADAATLCREGGIPTSKIYRAMERLRDLGLVQIQPSRPRLFAAPPPDAVAERVGEIARARADGVAAGARALLAQLARHAGRATGRHAFVDLALGADSHVTRHLVHLATARRRILSYMERTDLVAIDAAVHGGLPILRRIARNAAEHGVEHRVVFGFSYATAPVLIDFLKRHRAEIRHLTGVRYSGELGRSFHVVDEDMVVLPQDHPFAPGGRFASLLIRDPDLAEGLAIGFDGLWKKAMKDLREIEFQPVPPGALPREAR
jgi:HTH-type transcriptional regulator, sugar sensing transcriptional regulator